MRVEQRDLYFRGMIRTVSDAIVLTTLVFFLVLALSVGVTQVLGISVQDESLFFSAAVISIIVLGLCILRNRIVKNWAKRRDFDFMYMIQVAASRIDRIMAYCGVTFLVVFFGILVLRNGALLIMAQYAMIILGVVMLVDLVFSFFRRMFTEDVFAVLCLRAFGESVRKGLEYARRDQLIQGLRIFENRFKRYGIAVSSESLAFGVNLCLITGMDWEEDLRNCANAVQTPSQDHMERAKDSSLRLLGLARQHLDAGLGIPYPFWRRLATRLIIPEILGGVLSLVAVLIPILLVLMGFR